jgi:hypothetical protein
MLLTCECCGFSQDFQNGEEAFQAGWDAPPHFTQYVCCNLCPGSFVVLGITVKHEPAHEKWKKERRPKEFDIPSPAEREIPDIPL